MTLIDRIFELADDRNVTAGSMLMNLADGNDDAELSAIIVADCGYVSDSVIEDILEELED